MIKTVRKIIFFEGKRGHHAQQKSNATKI